MNRADVWSRFTLSPGDITRISCDAIVNAANERLAGGGGVDGAIHRAAGTEQLQAACRAIGGCPTGEAVITPGFNLPARWIVHAVGPIYRGGSSGEPQLLASAYRRSLQVAAAHGATTIAFPALSTGAYGYPFDEATRIALSSLAAELPALPTIARVDLVFFNEPALQRAAATLAEVRNQPPESNT